VKYPGKSHLKINMHIKNEGKKGKTGPIWG
jgi:hypothetical protein